MDYYIDNAEQFYNETVSLDLSTLYARFTRWLPPGGHILDAGCGSGRDALAFTRLGFQVTAFDASPALAGLASHLLGQPVATLRFQEMHYAQAFDGIWTCASLLHVPREELPGVTRQFIAALKPGGIWYLSFKLGDSDQIRHDRLFNDQNEETLGAHLGQFPELTIIDLWRTQDLRTDLQTRQWINCLVRKSTTP